MGIFEETVVKAKEIADITGKKAGEIINIQKMRVSAATLNSQISKLYEVLGRLAYDAAKTEADITAQSAQAISEIDEKREELCELKVKIAEARGKRICPACRTGNNADALFCDKCGQKLTFVAEPEVVDAADEVTDETE
jgi:hypothetical protein